MPQRALGLRWNYEWSYQLKWITETICSKCHTWSALKESKISKTQLYYIINPNPAIHPELVCLNSLRSLDAVGCHYFCNKKWWGTERGHSSHGSFFPVIHKKCSHLYEKKHISATSFVRAYISGNHFNSRKHFCSNFLSIDLISSLHIPLYVTSTMGVVKISCIVRLMSELNEIIHIKKKVKKFTFVILPG